MDLLSNNVQHMEPILDSISNIIYFNILIDKVSNFGDCEDKRNHIVLIFIHNFEDYYKDNF